MNATGGSAVTIRDDQFWADFLGIDPTEWGKVGVSIHPHAGLRGYRGLWCFRRGERTVVSAPTSWITQLNGLTKGRTGDELMQPAFWEQGLSDAFELAIGPAFQGRLDPVKFVKRANACVRSIGGADDRAVEQFRTACGAEWNMPDDATSFRHAYFERGVITALAGYRAWSENAGDPCVLARPDARSGGRGAAVTSAVVAEALAHGKLLLYQTLESNEPAVRIALSLGYERYANHLAIRLSRDAAAS
jgi:GNAT superfamily N-acetyltransferase